MVETSPAVAPAPVELSVVTPVYNGGEFFRATIESLLEQTLDRSRFEVVIVDDGSTDGSAELCDQFAREYPDLIRVFHQENSGSPAGPRNTGARLARGEYVFFVDADDLVPPDSFEGMLAHAREKNLDIGVFKVDASSWNQTYGGLFDEPQDHCTVVNSRIMNSLGPYKLFRRSIIVDNDITFPEGILYEDLPFVLECYLHAENISIITDRVYYTYRARDDGGSISQGVGEKRLDEQVEGVAHYFKVASRYATPQECPHIFLRGYRYLDYALPYLIKQKKDELLSQSADIAREHYCDQVRSLMPFSNMTRMDALTSGNHQLLAFMVNQQPGLAFTSREEDGRAVFELRALTDEGRYGSEPDLVSAVPCDFGWGRPVLENPQVVHNLITRAELSDGEAVFGGRLQLLRACEGAPVAARLRANHGATAPAALAIETCENVYADVRHIVATWTARIPLSSLIPPTEKRQLVHLYLDVEMPGGGIVENRFGKHRTPGTFAQFACRASLCNGWVLAPTETEHRNLSLSAVPADIAGSATIALSLTKENGSATLGVKGSLSFDNYPRTDLVLSLIDEKGACVRKLSLDKGSRRGDRRFSGKANVNGLGKGRYAVRLHAALGGSSVELAGPNPITENDALRRLLTTYRLEEADGSATLVIS